MVALNPEFKTKNNLTREEEKRQEEQRRLNERELEIEEDIQRALKAKLRNVDIKGAGVSEIASAVVGQLKDSKALLQNYLGDARSPEAQKAAMDSLVEKVESIFSNARVHVDTHKVADHITRSRQNNFMNRGSSTVEEVREALITYVEAAYVPNSLGISAHNLRGEAMSFCQKVAVIEEVRAREADERGQKEQSQDRRKRGREPYIFVTTE
jgi:hypothetical protein